MKPDTKTFLVTGANRGLGPGIARALAKDPSNRVELAVRDVNKGRDVAKTLGPNTEAHGLDQQSLEAVRAFASSWSEPLAGLVNNAGLQIVDKTRFTRDGYEETVAVNHLAAFQLTMGLLPRLEGARVLFISSGTINPANGLASRLGFRGARFTTVDDLARGRGEESATAKQLGNDRYATSKMMNVATAVELAKRIPSSTTSFFALDPGLMAGTGLVRTAPLPVRIGWNTILKWARPWMPGASTPERSGDTAAWILTAPGLETRSGEVFGPDRQRSSRLWEGAVAPDVTRRVVDETLAFLKLTLPRTASARPRTTGSSRAS
jgi:NAD(P)-dependent dehydrogenase (short-subunit alcohol dehydrogenase family)